MTSQPRYVALSAPPRAWDSETHSWAERPTCQVVEADPTPQATGLLDASGTPLYRLPNRVPMGFQVKGNASR
jgi:hypothetical protein